MPTYEIQLRRALSSEPEIWENWKLHQSCETEQEANHIVQQLGYDIATNPAYKHTDFNYQARRLKNGAVDVEFYDFLSQSDINDVMLALNHYISTGDHIGEGIVLPDDEEGFLRILIPYAPRELEDVDNWNRLYARLNEMQEKDAFPLAIVHMGDAPNGFTVKGIMLHQKHFPAFAKALREKPGPQGWGSMRSFLISRGIIPGDN